MLKVEKSRCYECGTQWDVCFFNEVLCSTTKEEVARKIRELLEKSGWYNVPQRILHCGVVWEYKKYENNLLVYGLVCSSAEIRMSFETLKEHLISYQIKEIK